jgi:hypothetical protein
MTTESFLSNAGWFFFSVWSVIVAAVSITAFGRDLLASKAQIEPLPKAHPSDSIQPNKTGLG